MRSIQGFLRRLLSLKRSFQHLIYKRWKFFQNFGSAFIPDLN
jgi:hypothetical protein